MILSLDNGKMKKPAVLTGRIIAYSETPVKEMQGEKEVRPVLIFQVAIQTNRNRDFYGNHRQGFETIMAKCFFRRAETSLNQYYALLSAKNNDRVILFGKIYDIGRKELNGEQKYFCRMNVDTVLFPEDIAAVRGANARAETERKNVLTEEDEYLF